jgi:pilus assembly protein CpaC
LHVLPDATRIEGVRQALQAEFPGQDISFDVNGANVILRGNVDDIIIADRAVAVVGTLGKVVNLLHVAVPPSEPQILLKVKFANLDRSVSQQLGANLFSSGAGNTPGSISTGQFGGPPNFDFTQTPYKFTVPDPLNIFFWKPDLNFGAYIQALEAKNLAQILAEPNLLTLSGHPANFLAGGEFPYPTLQGGGGGVGQITIQFREFGIRLNFVPTVTPRGTIRLEVRPEVSSLDPANGLTISGYTIPGLDIRKVETEVELGDGQSFVIAGLLDNRVTETLSKIPGLSNIPLLGKLFESRSLLKSNSELLVVVTPVIVKPIPAGSAAPGIAMPKPFLKGTSPEAPQNPALPSRPDAPLLPMFPSLPVEQLKNLLGTNTAANPSPVADPNANNNGLLNKLLNTTQPGPTPPPPAQN